jgi:hypothetical protein
MTEDRLKLIQAVTDLSQPELRRDKNIDMIVLFKQLVLKDLYVDRDIIETLHNPALEAQGATPEDYRGVNIFSFLKIPDTQSTVKNFICFDVNFNGDYYRDNPAFLQGYIIFRTVAHEDDVNTEYGIDRQDLLGMLIKDRYTWSNYMGMTLQLEYDLPKIAENGYYYREIRFKLSSPNSVVQRGTYINNMDRDRQRYGYQ